MKSNKYKYRGNEKKRDEEEENSTEKKEIKRDGIRKRERGDNEGERNL